MKAIVAGYSLLQPGMMTEIPPISMKGRFETELQNMNGVADISYARISNEPIMPLITSDFERHDLMPRPNPPSPAPSPDGGKSGTRPGGRGGTSPGTGSGATSQPRQPPSPNPHQPPHDPDKPQDEARLSEGTHELHLSQGVIDRDLRTATLGKELVAAPVVVTLGSLAIYVDA